MTQLNAYEGLTLRPGGRRVVGKLEQELLGHS